MNSHIQERIKLWLTNILEENNYKDFSFKIEGYSEKENGYFSDIIFVGVTNTFSDKLKIALKQSKNDKNFRKRKLMKNIFLNEIHMYETVLPTLKQFQIDKRVADVFNSVPKYYGKYIDDDVQVIALENLKSRNYELWDKREPLPRKYLEAVLHEYAKLHASSAALKFQQPDLFDTLASGVKKSFMAFEMKELDFMFGSKIEEACELLKDEIDDEVLQKWKNFRNELKKVFDFSFADNGQLRVFTHGDCWINNFLFKRNVWLLEQNPETPTVSLLDLQMSNTASPILDLSYFLFSAISSEDIDDLNSILKEYYHKFALYLEKLGSKADVMYPYQQFTTDWKIYCKYGLAIVPVCYYIYSTHPSEVPDSTECQNFETMFTYNIKDCSIFKQRTATLIKYAVKNDLL